MGADIGNGYTVAVVKVRTGFLTTVWSKAERRPVGQTRVFVTQQEATEAGRALSFRLLMSDLRVV